MFRIPKSLHCKKPESIQDGAKEGFLAISKEKDRDFEPKLNLLPYANTRMDYTDDCNEFSIFIGANTNVPISYGAQSALSITIQVGSVKV